MGSGSSKYPRSHSLMDDGQLMPADTPVTRTQSLPASINSLRQGSSCHLSREGLCTESPSMRRQLQSWLHPRDGGWAATSGVAESILGCHQAFPLQEVEHAQESVSSQIGLTRGTRDSAHPDSGRSNKWSGGSADSPDAAVVRAMAGLVDMIEARVTAGRSKLPMQHALPFLAKCRESLSSNRGDIRQCASSLHALGERLQNCSKLGAGTSHSCAPEVELIYEMVLRVRKASPRGADLEVAESLLALAKYYRAEGRFKEAIKHFQHLVGILSCQVGNSHPSVSSAFNFLAESLAHANRFREAEYACKRAIAIATTALGEENHHTQGFRRNLDVVWVMKAHYESGVSNLMAGGGTWQSGTASA
eukprot:jgi/Mesvir1/3396/Mv20133-RA.1